MKLLNFIILNFDFLILVESGITRINQSLFDSDSNFNLINDASDLFIFESFKNDNSNSIQTYPPNPFLNDPLHSFSLHELDYDHTPGISPTDSPNSAHLKHSEFISPILESSSSPQREIPTPKRKIPTPERKIPPSDINSKNANKRPRKGSKSNPEENELSKSSSNVLTELPYLNYNFPQNWKAFEPVDIGEIIAKKLINAVTLQNGKPFFELPEVRDNSEDSTSSYDKVFRLDIANVIPSQEFFSCFWTYRRVQTGTPDEKVDQPNRKTRKEVVWQKLVDSLDEAKSIKPEFLNYKEIVLLDFNEKINEVAQLVTDHLKIKIQHKIKEKNRKRNRKDQAQIHPFLKHFPRAMTLFPLFLLYVDLINTILPVKNFDKAGNIFREQRKIAGDGYLQVVKYLIGSRLDIEGLQIPIGKIDMLPSTRRKALFPLSPDRGISFVWQILHHWIVNSRPDIVKIAIVAQSISSQFRTFFNRVIECWSLS